MDKCPHCGSDKGVYVTYTGYQFYDFNGNSAGYNENVSINQIKYVRCNSCNRKISRNRFPKGSELN